MSNKPVDKRSFLSAIFEMKPLEPPSCECGATVGLEFRYNRHWCFDCVWALVSQQRTVIETRK